MAAGYARSRPPVHPRVIERLAERLAEVLPVGRALDVGCGAGLSTRPLFEIARCCVAIDPVEAMLRRAPGTAPQALFAVGRAEALPFLSNSIDLITAAGSLNYADLRLFFPEAVRVLRPGGILVIYDFTPGKSLRGRGDLDRWFAEFSRRYPPAPDCWKEISAESLRDSAAGFRLASYEPFEIGLVLDPQFYLDYIMTETNVAHAVQNGIPEQAIRDWCAGGLAVVFQGASQEVLFRGYIACLRPS